MDTSENSYVFTFVRRTKFIYNQYQTVASRLISMLTKENAVASKAEYNLSELPTKIDACCSTIYSAETSSNTRVRPARAWKKFWAIFKVKVKRSHAAIKKKIRGSKTNVIKLKIKLSSRLGHGERAANKTGSSSSVVQEFLKERVWSRVKLNRWAGVAPVLTREETLTRQLQKKASTRRVEAVEHCSHSSEPGPSLVTDPVLKNSLGAKSTCPSIDCVCSGNKLRPTAPGGLFFWLKSSISKLFFGNKPSAKAALPSHQSVFAEKELKSLQDMDLLKPRGPDFCLQGCRSLYYYDRSDLNIGSLSTVDKEKSNQDEFTVYKGKWDPLSRPNSITEQGNETLLAGDRVCTAYGKYSVSTQMQRGENGKFIIPHPYVVIFGQPDTTILKDLSGVKLSITLDTTASDKSGAPQPRKLSSIVSNPGDDSAAAQPRKFSSIVSNPGVKKYYDKLKKAYCPPICVTERSNDTTMQTDEVPQCHACLDTDDAGDAAASRGCSPQLQDSMCKVWSDAIQRAKTATENTSGATKELATSYFFLNLFKLIHFLHTRYLDSIQPEEAFDPVESLDDTNLGGQGHGDHREGTSLPRNWNKLFT